MLKQPVPILHRIVSTLVALVAGGFLGAMLLYLAMVVTGSDFGLDNVRPGFALGALVGLALALRYPEKVHWMDLF